jgi:hypothetical protein
MVKPRYIERDEAEKLGIVEGWYAVDDAGNRVTYLRFSSRAAVEKWIAENYPDQSPEPPRRRDPGPSM